MATSFAPVSISGGSHLKTHELCSSKSYSLGKIPKLAALRKSNQAGMNRKLSVRAEYHDGSRGGGGDFVAGFLLGGAIFGTLAYVFAPQIRKVAAK
ncbi:uncharacterized protein LOC105632476 [Jatropha curcas]|uniref:uncharacterized protein LOC105632476 n=1 Tax=Jatropha curcas TaxID=180498 RepID=UPI00189553EF|nr:uncharacterized protein LOC105632476 [Jatropha curcas]